MTRVFRGPSGLRSEDEALDERVEVLMARGLDWLAALAEARGEARTSRPLRRPAPGKVAVTGAVVARAVAGEGRARGGGAVVQARSAGGWDDEEPEALHALAGEAVREGGERLPYFEELQRAFGRHDLSTIQATTGGAAAAAATAMGAEAFAFGERVVFAKAPSLHTAAHEVAHVIQQRGGVEVDGGVGREGDRHEQHADDVADRVVRGESVESLLDRYLGPPVIPAAREVRDDRPKAKAEPAAAPAVAPAVAKGAAPAPVATPALQLRRIPPNVRALLQSITGSGGAGANNTAYRRGVRRLIARARSELTAAERATVDSTKLGGLTQAQFDALPEHERLSRHAEAIISLFPGNELGDPALIDVGPQNATQTANLATVVGNTDAVFGAIAGGAHDTSIGQIFGTGNIAAAKAKFANGRTWMNSLHGSGNIVTDRSGYNDEVALGGLTGFQTQISVSPDVIDNPAAVGSIITMFHESMHAGNNDVTDQLYTDQGGFTSQTEAMKLTNAAHFEVQAWRIKDPTNASAFPVTPATVPPTFQTFIPPGVTIGGVTGAARTVSEDAAEKATDVVREAWTLALNLHNLYVHLLQNPTDWRTPLANFGSRRPDRAVPFWSKVQMLTVHDKSSIDPSSSNPARHPISQIDVALSEGFTRRMAIAMQLLAPLETDADVQAFFTANATSAERAAAFPSGRHTSRTRETRLLLKLAMRDTRVHPITGSVDRDIRVARKMGDPPMDLWSVILAPRDPDSFS